MLGSKLRVHEICMKSALQKLLPWCAQKLEGTEKILGGFVNRLQELL